MIPPLPRRHIAHLLQQCENWKSVIFQEKRLKVLKFRNFLWVQRRHSCSPAASFANCTVTLHLFKVHLQTFLSIPIAQKWQFLSCDTLIANDRYVCKLCNVLYYVLFRLQTSSCEFFIVVISIMMAVFYPKHVADFLEKCADVFRLNMFVSITVLSAHRKWIICRLSLNISHCY